MSAKMGDHQFPDEGCVLLDVPEAEGWITASASTPVETEARSFGGTSLHTHLATNAELGPPDATTATEGGTGRPALEDPSG